MGDRAAELLRQHVKEQEARTERLRTILKFLEEDPTLATEFAKVIHKPEANGKIFPPRIGGDIPDSPNLAPQGKRTSTLW